MKPQKNPFVPVSQSMHLTKADIGTAGDADQTFAGMAHFAGTGPAGKVCGTCRHFQVNNNKTCSRMPDSRLGKPAVCLKARKLMGGATARIPSRAAACKYYEGTDT
ncbi:hypothetical protein [Roseibium sp. RKSG952]|uniref:hypothetical protein n=1 Tax=Roseibium sp. RKSG952 TaxID=2529384 RepID=UPI0012BC412B|nr:hypothetical protein [Roseibium sp. RKSG952]MTH96664.1 hypothetical protein [Roseibium sp. RKSG952]